MLPIGDQIYLARLERGLTQKELARRAGLPQPNLSDIEKGKQDMTLTTLRKIAYALEVPIAEFFELPMKGLRLTRPRIEKIARALVRKDSSLNPAEKKAVRLFREILPGKNQNQIRRKRLYRSWLELKKQFRPQEIHAIYERIQEAQRRSL